MAIGLGQFDHRRIHLGELEGLAIDGRLQVLGGGVDHLQGLEMALGMNALGLGGGAKELGDIDETVFFRLLGKSAVFLVGLAFAGKGFLEIVGGRCHDSSIEVDIVTIPMDSNLSMPQIPANDNSSYLIWQEWKQK